MTQAQFDQLIALLGQVGSAAYAAAMRYAVASIVIQMLAGALILLAALVAQRWIGRIPAKDSDGDIALDRFVVELIRGFIVGLGIILIVSNIPALISPEYAALKFLAALVH